MNVASSMNDIVGTGETIHIHIHFHLTFRELDKLFDITLVCMVDV